MTAQRPWVLGTRMSAGAGLEPWQNGHWAPACTGHSPEIRSGMAPASHQRRASRPQPAANCFRVTLSFSTLGIRQPRSRAKTERGHPGNGWSLEREGAAGQNGSPEQRKPGWEILGVDTPTLSGARHPVIAAMPCSLPCSLPTCAACLAVSTCIPPLGANDGAPLGTTPLRSDTNPPQPASWNRR